MPHTKTATIHSTSSRGLTAGSRANNYSPLRDSRLRGNDGGQAKHHGIGLLELMLSLAIIAAVILLATRYFSQASESSKVTQSTQIIHTLIDASFKWVESQPNFAAMCVTPGCNGTTTLVDAGILPKDWSSKKDPWGGDITLTNEGDNQIKITLSNAPISACKSINDIMINQGVAPDPNDCKNTSYTAIYPKDDPYKK